MRDPGIRRRFLLLAATLELADRERQSIHDDHVELREEAKRADGIGDVPVERSAVRDALDEAFPGAARASDDDVDWILEQFERLGVRSMDEVRTILTAVPAARFDELLRVRYPRCQRQQVDDALPAAFGERYIGQFGANSRVARLRWPLAQLRKHDLAQR